MATHFCQVVSILPCCPTVDYSNLGIEECTQTLLRTDRPPLLEKLSQNSNQPHGCQQPLTRNPKKHKENPIECIG